MTEAEFFNDVVSMYYYVPIAILIPLFFVNAFYGKFQASKFTYLNIPGKLGWFIMESVSPLIFLYGFLLPSSFIKHNNESLSRTTTQKILVSLYLLHYFNRVIIYTYRAPSIAPVHLLVILVAILFNLINGYCNGRWISLFYYRYPEEGYKEPLFILGIIIFFIGMWINIKHDNILFKLREKKEKNNFDVKNNDFKKKYFIPNEGLFNYISCPNYFGEIIEWIGFTIACWYSIPALLFSIATSANLLPRAIQTLKWYRENFKEYPKERKAIIPFVL